MLNHFSWPFWGTIATARATACLWLSCLIEENEVGDDDPADRQDERSGDLEEAKSGEDGLGTPETDQKGLQHPLLLQVQRLQGCPSKAFKTQHCLSLDIAGGKCNVEEADGGGGEDYDEEPEGHHGRVDQVADEEVDGEDDNADEADEVGGDDQAKAVVHILNQLHQSEVLATKFKQLLIFFLLLLLNSSELLETALGSFIPQLEHLRKRRADVGVEDDGGLEGDVDVEHEQCGNRVCKVVLNCCFEVAAEGVEGDDDDRLDGVPDKVGGSCCFIKVASILILKL